MGKVIVNIHCNINDFADKEFWFLKTGGAKIPRYYLLILAMASNAGYHYTNIGEDEVCDFYVKAEDEYIVFSNKLSSEGLSDGYCKNIEGRARLKAKCPPWEFDEERQSITLWTLSHYFEKAENKIKGIFREERKEWLSIKVKDNIFCIKLRVLNRKKGEDGNGN